MQAKLGRGDQAAGNDRGNRETRDEMNWQGREKRCATIKNNCASVKLFFALDELGKVTYPGQGRALGRVRQQSRKDD